MLLKDGVVGACLPLVKNITTFLKLLFMQIQVTVPFELLDNLNALYVLVQSTVRWSYYPLEMN